MAARRVASGERRRSCWPLCWSAAGGTVGKKNECIYEDMMKSEEMR